MSRNLINEIQSDLNDLENLNKHSKNALTDAKLKLKAGIAKLSPEQKKQYERIQKRIDICVKNNDTAGLRDIQNNFR